MQSSTGTAPVQGQNVANADSRTSSSQAGTSKAAIALTSNPQGVTPPHLITALDPDYPDDARRAKAQGVVLVECMVGTDGTVSNARILNSLRKDLDASALDAVRRWRFEPAIKDGKPVAVQIRVEVTFRLYKDDAATN
jgi:TonB family protein